MKCKMKKTALIGSLSLLVSFIAIISLSNAYWGLGDCQDGHPVVIIRPLYSKNAEINLDGIASESFWSSSENENGTLTVPLASDIGTSSFFVVYLNLTFVMNDEYLYILCHWLDNTTRPDLGGNNYDGLYFCWNINVPNFTAYFINGMITADMGGGDVDNWDWTCMSSSPPNGSSYFCQDLCFGTSGWYDPSLELDDVKIGYTYINNVSYTLEIQRKLQTNDPYDVQFDKTQLYKFNIGLMNDGTHEDHAVSWTHALDLKFDDIEQPFIDGYILSFVYMLMLISIIIYIKKQKFSSKIKNL